MMTLKDALPDALEGLGVRNLDQWNAFCDNQKRQSRETARLCALATPQEVSPENEAAILDALSLQPYSIEALETYQLTRSELFKSDV